MRKNNFFLAVIPIVLVCGSFVIYSNVKFQRIVEDLNQARYERMLAEENFQKATTKINSLELEVERVREKMGSVKKLLEHNKTINADLKNRLDQAAKIQEELDEKIRSFTASE